MNLSCAEEMLGFRIGEGWVFHEVLRFGELAGFVMQKEDEIHQFRKQEFNGRWFTKNDLQRIVIPILKKYGRLKTKVMASNVAGQKFVERLGFEFESVDGSIINYIAKEIRHAKHS